MQTLLHLINQNKLPQGSLDSALQELAFTQGAESLSNLDYFGKGFLVPDPYFYRLYAWEWYDGDTLRKCILDTGMGKYELKSKVRLWGINTPEVNKRVSREAGIAARDYAKSLMPDQKIYYKDNKPYLMLNDQLTDQKAEPILIRSYKDEKGSFGRFLAEVYNINSVNLNLMLLLGGYAKFDIR